MFDSGELMKYYRIWFCAFEGKDEYKIMHDEPDWFWRRVMKRHFREMTRDCFHKAVKIAFKDWKYCNARRDG